MSITVSIESKGPEASVQVRGDLNAMSQGTLKAQMEPVFSNSSISKINLDFSGVKSIEPSSTGMLMLLSHTAKAKNKIVAIVNAIPAVLSLMRKANLAKIMPIQ